MNNFKLVLLAIVVAIFIFLAQKAKAQDGKDIYTAKCIRCHNADPRKSGSVGPDLAGSSLELITLKTQKRQYPKGYTPKRKTKIMPIIKLTEAELKALHSYINSFKKAK